MTQLEMRKLLLVKHSLPEILPEVHANQWRLSTEGRHRCKSLSLKLAAYQPAAMISSEELKALETAESVANNLGMPFEIAKDLNEHDRSNESLFQTHAEFVKFMKLFFAKPDELVFGKETGIGVQNRFVNAVNDVLQQHQKGNVVIFAHGTVISLFVSAYTSVEPFPMWQQLGLPSIVVLLLPNYELVKVIEKIE